MFCMFWMAWREYLIRFPIALLISWWVWIIPLWIWTAFQDAKKRRKHEKEECYYQRKNAELDQRIEELENDIEWCNAILDDYIGYTWIFPREITEKLEKRNKRKKRK